MEIKEFIINNTVGNLYWKDKDGRYLGCNKAYSDMIGLSSPSEIVGKTDRELHLSMSVEKLKIIEEADQRIMNNRQEEVLYEEGIGKSGNKAFYLTKKIPLIGSDDKVIGLMGTSIDITKEKKAELAYKLFLENMTQYIRTPLAGITGFASIIAEESKDPKIKDHTENLIASSQALGDLLNEILEVIRVGSYEIPLLKKKFNLKDKLLEVIKLTKARALQKNLQLTLDYDDNIPSFVLGDSTRIHRVVLELVTNALNFTDKGFVKLSVRLEKETEREIILALEVEDTGVGIPPGKKQEVFLRFKRLTPSYEGIYRWASLGLSIVKQFVDDLDGEIYIKSRKGGGTRFIVILSLTKSLIQSEFGVNLYKVAF